MTKRVRQHELEDISRSKYNLAIPEGWVFRDKPKDYGIDAEIEIFEKNSATGLVYWAQLKATETSKENLARKLKLGIESIEYYKKLDIPVLIVRYSHQSGLFYCKWVHEIDLYYAKKNAKTITLTFEECDIWNNEFSAKTIINLGKIRAIKSGAISLPLTVSLDLKMDSIGGIPRGIFTSKFRQQLKQYSPIVIYESNSEKSFVNIVIKNNELTVFLSGFNGCTLHGINELEKDRLAEMVASDALLGLAVSMTQAGQHETAARIFLDKKLIDKFLEWEDVFCQFIPTIVKTSRYIELIDAVCEKIDSRLDNNLLENIAVIAMVMNANSVDEERCNKLQHLLDKCLEKAIAMAEKTRIGIAHYNLANHYQSRGLSRKSAQHFLLARRFEPKYLEQIYFYSELGGALFELGKYRFSSCLYKHALDKGASSSIKPLYADALMFGGDYKTAFEVFSEYLSSNQDDHAEWHLKTILLQSLIDQTGIIFQDRQIKRALDKIDITNPNDLSFSTNLEKVLEIDMLCGLAWFNLGISQGKKGLHDKAAASFIACSLVQAWDIEAWVNATLSCIHLNHDSLLLLVVNAAYTSNGEEYLLALHERLKVGLSGTPLIEIINLIDELLPKKKEPSIPSIRKLCTDGVFRNVFTGRND